MWYRYCSLILDAIIPPSRDVALTKSLSLDDLARLLHPRAHPDFPWITTLFPYAHPKIRALIRSIKYGNEQDAVLLVGKIAADEILSLLEEKQLFSGWEKPSLVPVPSSPERMRLRGYNQAARIAIAISNDIEGMRYEPTLLTREERQSQVRLPNDKRRTNIRGAFRATGHQKVRGKHIVLLDDVAESGYTLDDARRALVEAGAADVIAVALAH